MIEEDGQLRIHLLVSTVVFVVLFFVRFIFARAKINYGYGAVTFGSVLFLLFGFYLIFIASSYFKSVFYKWKEGNSWGKPLLRFYLLLLLFCVFIVLIYLSGSHGSGQVYFDIIGNPIDFFFDDFPAILFVVGLSIVFPVSVYSLLISIKSLAP